MDVGGSSRPPEPIMATCSEAAARDSQQLAGFRLLRRIVWPYSSAAAL